MNPMLTLERVHKIFEAGTPNENHVLKGLDLTLQSGEFITVIGGNGAGKSTMLNVISGALTPNQGEVILDGDVITRQSVANRARYISRVFQDPRLGTAAHLTIEENLAIAYKRGKRRTLNKGINEDAREFFKEHLKRLELGLEARLKTDAGYLSGGQRQALTLMMATIVRPKVLLLDEHTAALDPKTSAMVMEMTDQIVSEDKLSGIMVTHNMEDAIKYGNRLIMLHQGRVVVDISGEDKQSLTIVDVLDLFKSNSGETLNSDELLLG